LHGQKEKKKIKGVNSIMDIDKINELYYRHSQLLKEDVKEENAGSVDVSNEIRIKLGQAYNIVKGLIELLDKTPTGQTPYNEMAITHLANLEEDIKTLSQILQDRMLRK